MNIFYLHDNPEVAASWHCDKHCIKMILESAQLLSTAHRELDGDEYADSVNLYKSFSPNHPSNIWIREARANYRWVWDLLFALCSEYTERYDKVHAVQRNGILSALAPSPSNIPLEVFSQPPQCMPDEYKVQDDTVLSYRNYYHGEKAYFAKWRLGEPTWWKGAA